MLHCVSLLSSAHHRTHRNFTTESKIPRYFLHIVSLWSLSPPILLACCQRLYTSISTGFIFVRNIASASRSPIINNAIINPYQCKSQRAISNALKSCILRTKVGTTEFNVDLFLRGKILDGIFSCKSFKYPLTLGSDA